jgi:hypothetical protein
MSETFDGLAEQLQMHASAHHCDGRWHCDAPHCKARWDVEQHPAAYHEHHAAVALVWLEEVAAADAGDALNEAQAAVRTMETPSSFDPKVDAALTRFRYFNTIVSWLRGVGEGHLP